MSCNCRKRAKNPPDFDPWAILRDLRAIELLDQFDPDQGELPLPLEIERRLPLANFPRPFSCEG